MSFKFKIIFILEALLDMVHRNKLHIMYNSDVVILTNHKNGSPLSMVYMEDNCVFYKCISNNGREIIIKSNPISFSVKLIKGYLDDLDFFYCLLNESKS